MKNSIQQDTICALATPAGMGALAVIRLSGPDALKIGSEIYRTRKGLVKDFEKAKGYTLHFGNLMDQNQIVDEVLLSIFKNPNSYTGEDLLEFSCHGSVYIQQQVLCLLIKQGARMANPGEFTQRAFLNGKMDLSQAEAVSDLISSSHESAHQAAIKQLRGGYSTVIAALRAQLIDFASLLELELDFAEEDVEFANRDKLRELINTLLKEISALRNSFHEGNAMKEGIPVVIAGKPNTGKSTLLNALLNDERAIVSSIAGTTRDVVEDTLVIQGRKFRFMDTAGLRISDDTIEQIGVERTYTHAAKSSLALYLCDPTQSNYSELIEEINAFKQKIENDISIIPVINKIDTVDDDKLNEYRLLTSALFISAKNKVQIDQLKNEIVKSLKFNEEGDSMLVTNARHASALAAAQQDLERLLEGMNNQLSTDLLAFECRHALHHLGEITGHIYTEDLLVNIFSKFCIGK